MEYNTLKVALVGPSRAGKTCLGRVITKQIYDSDYIPTIGSDMHYLHFPDTDTRILFWDISGDNNFSFIEDSYVAVSHYVCLCYDSTDYDSYVKLKEKYLRLKDKIDDKHICVVSMKNDDPKGKNCDWGMELAVRLDCSYLVTSARTGNVKEVTDWVMDDAQDEFYRFNPTINKINKRVCWLCNIL